MKKGEAGHGAHMAVHLVCCGAILLFATGLLSFGTVVAWLGNGPVRVAGIAVLSLGVLVFLLRRSRRGSLEAPANKTGEAGLDR